MALALGKPVPVGLASGPMNGQVGCISTPGQVKTPIPQEPSEKKEQGHAEVQAKAVSERGDCTSHARAHRGDQVAQHETSQQRRDDPVPEGSQCASRTALQAFLGPQGGHRGYCRRLHWLKSRGGDEFSIERTYVKTENPAL